MRITSGVSSAAGGADEHRDAARQREPSQDGAEIHYRLAARVGDALVGEGDEAQSDERDPDDHERHFHGVSPGVRAWSRLSRESTARRIASSRSCSSNGLRRYAAAPDSAMRSPVATSS